VVETVLVAVLLVAVLLIVVVRTPMQMYCLVAVVCAADPVDVEK
jgi:hypothetical protein